MRRASGSVEWTVGSGAAGHVETGSDGFSRWLRSTIVGTWVALLSALAGGAIALTGQYLTRRLDNRSRASELLLELSATIVSLSEDYRNRLWEERLLGQAGRVEGWDFAAARLAEARLRIVARDDRLLDALDEVSRSGGDLGRYWRRGQIEDDELQRRSDRNKEAIQAFLRVARQVVGTRLRA